MGKWWDSTKVLWLVFPVVAWKEIVTENKLETRMAD